MIGFRKFIYTVLELLEVVKRVLKDCHLILLDDAWHKRFEFSEAFALSSPPLALCYHVLLSTFILLLYAITLPNVTSISIM